MCIAKLKNQLELENYKSLMRLSNNEIRILKLAVYLDDFLQPELEKLVDVENYEVSKKFLESPEMDEETKKEYGFAFLTHFKNKAKELSYQVKASPWAMKKLREQGNIETSSNALSSTKIKDDVWADFRTQFKEAVKKLEPKFNEFFSLSPDSVFNLVELIKYTDNLFPTTV